MGDYTNNRSEAEAGAEGAKIEDLVTMQMMQYGFNYLVCVWLCINSFRSFRQLVHVFTRIHGGMIEAKLQLQAGFFQNQFSATGKFRRQVAATPNSSRQWLHL